MIITYASETVLPSYIYDLFEDSKKEICALSLEPDKTILSIDELRRQIITWFAYHVTDNKGE
jgi:hypothetical protein